VLLWADVRGALGTISLDDLAPRRGMPAKLKTLLAIVGPGLIVMVGDNDAGAFSVCGQAGQDYGTRLLWTFALLIPVLYVNQEMVLRLGAATGVGHARLILERLGRFWGAFERIAMIFCAGSLLLIPVYVLSHPAAGQIARGFLLPSVPGGGGQLATVMLLVIGIGVVIIGGAAIMGAAGAVAVLAAGGLLARRAVRGGGMTALRVYLGVAMVVVIIRIVQVAAGG
jgi:hypothetical protein